MHGNLLPEAGPAWGKLPFVILAVYALSTAEKRRAADEKKESTHSEAS